LKLALTSDFPSTANDPVVACIRSDAVSPRVAWIPPLTAVGRARFSDARSVFRSFGVPALEYCDIDEEPNEHQLARLSQYDVVYFTGGDPVAFRRNIIRCGLSVQLRECLAAGRLIVAASGGTMQFTPNISLFRLLSGTVDDVVAERDEYGALGIVDYEVLPHLNRHDPAFLEKVRGYSERVPHDIVGLDDGAAMIYAESGDYRCIRGAVRFRGGIRTSIEATA
jgi:dipeptidase E